jgi:hypothetical protein
MSTRLKRREFLWNVAGMGATLGVLGISDPKLAVAEPDPAPCEASFPQVKGLTAQVAEFVVNLRFADIPPETLELGKKSILDGLGLALSGSKAETWGLIQEYLKNFVFARSGGAAVSNRPSLRSWQIQGFVHAILAAPPVQKRWERSSPPKCWLRADASHFQRSKTLVTATPHTPATPQTVSRDAERRDSSASAQER